MYTDFHVWHDGSVSCGYSGSDNEESFERAWALHTNMQCKAMAGLVMSAREKQAQLLR